MTGNLLIDTLISIAAIAVMVAVARLFFPTPAAPVTEASAMDRLALDEPDFKPRAWLIDHEGRAALAEGADSDFVLVKRVGLDLVSRRFRAEAVKAAHHNDELAIEFADTTLPRAVILNGGAAEWVQKLTMQDDG